MHLFIKVEGDKYKECIKCHNDGKRWSYNYEIRNTLYCSYSGPFWCNTCDESFCDECGSHNLQSYDDGEGYPPNILCKDCGHWPQ